MSDNLYVTLRDEQQARLARAMKAPISACTSDACGQDSRRCPTPEACHLPVQFTGPEPSADEFFDWMGDLAAAAKTLLWWLLVIVVGFIAAYLVGAGINALTHHWPAVVAALS
jgi:hypothetical protein